MKEIWKECPLNKSIKISNKGNVKGAKLLLSKDKLVYITVRDTFFKNNRYVHSLVYELFGTGEVPANKLFHIDGNAYNNNISNIGVK